VIWKKNNLNGRFIDNSVGASFCGLPFMYVSKCKRRCVVLGKLCVFVIVQEIDGKYVLLLNVDVIVNYLNIKIDPAMKLKTIIDKLQACVMGTR